MNDSDDDRAWDADDPRRQKDCFAPPTEPCECSCLHCGRTFSSDEIWLQRIINGDDRDPEGYWMCPTPNCGGAGFAFDIFPTDPDHPANAGWHYDDDDGEEEWSEDSDESDESDDTDDEFVNSTEEGDEPLDPEIQAGIDHDLEIMRKRWAAEDEPLTPQEQADVEHDLEILERGWDADESDDADDSFIEPGDEWKLGYAPDEPAPPGIYGDATMRAEQAKYDEPDRRPRVIDRAKEPREQREFHEPRESSGSPDGSIRDDDIPF